MAIGAKVSCSTAGEPRWQTDAWLAKDQRLHHSGVPQRQHGQAKRKPSRQGTLFFFVVFVLAVAGGAARGGGGGGRAGGKASAEQSVGIGAGVSWGRGRGRGRVCGGWRPSRNVSRHGWAGDGGRTTKAATGNIGQQSLCGFSTAQRQLGGGARNETRAKGRGRGRGRGRVGAVVVVVLATLTAKPRESRGQSGSPKIAQAVVRICHA